MRLSRDSDHVERQASAVLSSTLSTLNRHEVRKLLKINTIRLPSIWHTDCNQSGGARNAEDFHYRKRSQAASGPGRQTRCALDQRAEELWRGNSFCW